ncbi:MAG: tetratricopeptide repeat protein [Gemmataceae bacterium]|nr:tetratricopeptide repeat protein [Gemmataceae bacterium]
MRCIIVFCLICVSATAAAQTAAELRERGQANDKAGKYAEAVADYTKALELDPKDVGLHHLRGCAEFKRGKIAESIADFDKYIALVPKAKVSHWQRGISYYYAGRWDDGIAQFEGYQTYDSNDVENAVWRFMCMARKDGIPKARKEILKIGEDKRVPMRQVYDLYAGKLKVDDVLAAAKAGAPAKDRLNGQLFYAHLYVGIYLELEGNKKLALEHLRKAADEHRIGHYMWDVARVHRDILRKELDKQ